MRIIVNICCKEGGLNRFGIVKNLVLLITVLSASISWAQSIQLSKPEIINARQGLPQAFVPAIVQDRLGFIWMATRDGLCQYDGYNFRIFQPSSNGRPALSSPGLTNLTMAPDGRIWISTDQRDLDCFDPVHETFENVSRQPYYKQAFGQDTLDAVYPDNHHQLWLIFRGRGLVRFDLRTHRFIRFTYQSGNPYSLASNFVNDVLEDKQNVIWIATQQGLDRYDPYTGRFSHFRHQPNQPQTLPEDAINRLYRRANGELWLCSPHHLTRWQPRTNQVVADPLVVNVPYMVLNHQIVTDSQGNDYIRINDQLMRYTNKSGLQLVTPVDIKRSIVALFIDQSDVLWVGTDLDGVYKFNLRAAPFNTHPYNHSFQQDLLTEWLTISANQLVAWPVGLSPYNIRATIDSTRHLWITQGDKAMYRVEGKRLQSVPFPVPLPDYKLDRPTPLATDPDGRIWVVHPNWSGYYQPSTGQWTQFPFPLQPAISSAMLQLVVDQQYLWIATAGAGLYRVNRHTGRIDQFKHQPHNAISLSSNGLYWISADPLDANLLWIGTFGSGLCRFDKRTGYCQRITTQQGLPNNVIYAAIPDRLGSIWVATNQGLGQLNRRTGQVRIYTQEDGLSADEFNRFHALLLPDGRIVLGGIQGITGFDPAHIRLDTFQPRVQLTDLFVNNRSISAQQALTNEPISKLTSLRLPHNQNFVTVRFAAMQYNRLGRTQYRYQLVGLDKDWIVTSRPEVIYTTLPPGNYQLRIQAANTAGQWSRHQYTLGIVIESPWWQTWWAWMIYVLLGIGLLWGFIRYRIQQIQNEQVRLNQQREAEQLRTVDELKTHFFANITHEFRTPLTLILSPVEALLTELRQSQYAERLSLIERNARQLLSLINQLLDLARLDARLMTVTPSQGHPDSVVANVLETFTDAAAKAHINLVYESQGGGLYSFDSDKLTHIVTNLVANALKFTSGTPDQPGQITVQLYLKDSLQLTVSDTGIGIPPDQLAHLFNRFYRINTQARPQSTGTGIGLALVKELVDLQQGTITVKSQLGLGTTFQLSLPYQSITHLHVSISTAASSDEQPTDTHSTELSEAESAVLLLVEDNDEMAHFISQCLPTTYQIQRAVDGLDGLKQAQQLMPNLIISDVMMPRMDGYQLCQHLKTDHSTNHIPVILLTAKVSVESRMHGLNLGADEYLDKPFHVAELQLRVHNLLTTQRRFREQIQTELHSPVIRSLSEPAHPFLQILYELLDQHLDNASFGAEELAQHADMSRMQLFRKLKALVGLPATDFIREYRLKQSIKFLQQGLSVSQTAYAVGFESPSYFGQCFRQQFGQPPSRFITKSIE